MMGVRDTAVGSAMWEEGGMSRRYSLRRRKRVERRWGVGAIGLYAASKGVVGVYKCGEVCRFLEVCCWLQSGSEWKRESCVRRLVYDAVV